MQRLWTSRSSISRYLAVQQLKSRASNSLSSVQETFHATKDVFEKHKIVFTVSTSIASVAVAWTGYNIRRLHQSKVEKRLDSIEKAVSTPKSQIASFIATSGTTLIIGYLMGFRGGKRFATRKLRKEQMKMLGQMSKPKRFEFLRRSLIRRRSPESASESDSPHTRPKKWQLGFLRRPRRLPENAPESLKKDVPF